MTTPKDAFLKGDFDRGLTLIGFYEKLQSWGLILLPKKHKIWVYHELIALKTKDGVRATCDICLDWLKQSFTLNIDDLVEETWKVKLE